MFVILTGAPSTGKDTLADLLCARYVLERRAFADPLRAMALIGGQSHPHLLPWVHETIWETTNTYADEKEMA